MFFSFQLNVNFVSAINLVKQGYSLETVKLIDNVVSKVKLNCPKIYNILPNIHILENAGIDTTIPIYVCNDISLSELLILNKAFEISKFTCVIYGECKYISLAKFFYKFLNKSFISQDLYSNINLLNINFKRELIKINFNKFDGFVFNLNNNILNFKTSFNYYYLNYSYKNQNIKISLTKYFYKNIFYEIEIENFSKKNQKLNFNFFKNLFKDATNYYHISKLKNKAILHNVINNYKVFIKTNVNFNMNFSQTINDSNAACITLAKHITVKANKKLFLKFCHGNNQLTQSEFLSSNNLALESHCNEFKLKIFCENQVLENYFNTILPQKITLNKLLEKKEFGAIGKNCSFEDALANYKNGIISALTLYNHIKNNLVGFNEYEETIFINSKLNFNFNLSFLYRGRNIIINIVKGNKNYMEVGGVKYHNVKVIPKKLFATNFCFMFVIQ